MLDSLITSKTRLRLLLRFFSNTKSSAHLRGLAKEMNESTNSIRLELNKLSKAGFLRKYLGLDKVVENIVNQIGEIKYAFIIGDYADGKDTGTINLVIVGAVDSAKLKYWVHKTETIISRKVQTDILNDESFVTWKLNGNLNSAIVLWTNNPTE